MKVKWKKLVMIAMAVLVLFFGRVDYLQAQEVYSEGYFQYTLDETGATIILYYGQEETVVVPEILGGKPVVAISDDAFSTYGGSVHDLVLPSTIVNTDSEQWEGLDNLENVEVKEEEDVLDLPDATGEASANQQQESPIVSDLVENVDDVEELLEEDESGEDGINLEEEDTSEMVGNSEQETKDEESKSEENSDSEQGNDIGAETESQSTQSSSSSQEQTEEKVSSKAEVESQSLNSERLNQNVTEENEKNTVVIVMIVVIVIVVAAAIAIWIKRRNHKE